MNFIKMSDMDLAGKRVLIREDLNVPIKDGLITSDQRLQAALPALEMALKANAAVIVLSHLGRPSEGVVDSAFSLKPVAAYLKAHLPYPVRFVTDYLTGVDVKPGELVLCENVRFNKGEKANDNALAKQLAALCDVFVMDAFGTAHRAHASTCGVAKFAATALAQKKNKASDRQALRDLLLNAIQESPTSDNAYLQLARLYREDRYFYLALATLKLLVRAVFNPKSFGNTLDPWQSKLGPKYG